MTGPRASLRDRGVPLLACVLILTAGLVVHASNALPLADKLGDALYAALVVALLWLVRPAAPWGALAAAALAWCWAVELLQLTSFPGAAARLWSPTRLVLGSGFDPLDLLAYAVGVGLAVAAVTAVRGASDSRG